jgi:hypothetical protein
MTTYEAERMILELTRQNTELRMQLAGGSLAPGWRAACDALATEPATEGPAFAVERAIVRSMRRWLEAKAGELGIEI